VLSGAEPFSRDGGDLGILLCHGFTGSPQSLRPWAQRLADAGHTVRLPRLPGHGTTWQEMNRTRWQDWYAVVEQAFLDLRGRCRTVVVGGLSMGGALALRLAQEHREPGTGVDGLVLVNPAVLFEDRRLVAVPVLRWVTASMPGVGNDIKRAGVTELAYDRAPLHALHSMLQAWRVVIKDLPLVHQPVLIFRSPQDHVVPASSTALILERISSTDATEVLCIGSYHVATLDNDADRIAEGSLAFASGLRAGSEGAR
jgi:carboxylesterase